jgi:subtilisin family serine protease
MKKLLLAFLVSVFAFVSPVSAGTLYDTIFSIKNKNTQTTLATTYMKKYLGYIETYSAYLNANKHMSGNASYKSLEARVEMYKEDVANFAILLGVTNPLGPTIVNTASTSTQHTTTTVSDPVLVNTVVSNDTVYTNTTTDTYEVTVKYYQTTTTIKVIETVVATTYYNDGTTKSDTTTNIISTSSSVSQTQTTDRVLISSVQNVQTSQSEFLTAEEYAARDDVSLAGTQTFIDAVKVTNPYFTDTTILSQYGLGKYANWLPATGANVAWSRGYTGKGSTIAILDTGIDLDHPEFEGRISATKCFTVMCKYGYETVQDNNSVSHGTHVAGIAAAALDGVGMTGVAPDANLLIGKIGHDNGYVELDQLGNGIAWAVSNGADVVNVSSEMSMDSNYRNSVVSVGDGFYYSTYSPYQSLGYNQILNSDNFTAPVVTAMSGNDTVLVIAAGNQGLAFPAFPAHYATITDENGNLALDGRVIIAGSFDLGTNKIATYSNRAGTMCYDYNDVTNQCNNTNRISDYYLMAPGTWVTSTNNGGDYRALSGTSMAAPAISGGVALVHQMWPYMTGDNVVKLLMETADKSFAGYDVNVHGQGLMDLDNATTPQGAIGIPTTGRVDGATASLNGQLSVAGMNMASLSSMMVVDDYDRNFSVDGNKMNVATDTRTVNPVLAASYNSKADGYMGYTKGLNINIGSIAVSTNQNGSNYGISYNTEYMTFGVLKENGSFLGNVARSPIMNVTGATTTYLSFNHEIQTDSGSLFGSFGFSATDLKVGENSMMKNSGTVLGNTASIGAKFKTKNGQFGVVAALPVAIQSGNVAMEYASSVSAEGVISTNMATESLANKSREVNLGLFYNVDVAPMTNVSMFAEVRENYMGIAGETAPQIGFTLTQRF